MDSLVVDAKPSKNTKPGVARSIEIACKRLSIRALKVIESIMNDQGADPKVRMQACQEILNRGFGRPKASVETNINVNAGDSLLKAITERRAAMALFSAESEEKEVEKLLN